LELNIDQARSTVNASASTEASARVKPVLKEKEIDKKELKNFSQD